MILTMQIDRFRAIPTSRSSHTILISPLQPLLCCTDQCMILTWILRKFLIFHEMGHFSKSDMSGKSERPIFCELIVLLPMVKILWKFYSWTQNLFILICWNCVEIQKDANLMMMTGINYGISYGKSPQIEYQHFFRCFQSLNNFLFHFHHLLNSTLQKLRP